MAYMVITWCQRGSSETNYRSRGAGEASSGVVIWQIGSPSSGIERFVKKLKKRSRMLCMADRTPAFHCQYDPLNYARNFDRNSFGSDSPQFCHTFSARFTMASLSITQEVTSSH